MRYPIDIDDEEYENRNLELHSRVSKGEKLSNDDTAFFCHCLHSKDLLSHPICEDEFYSRTFLKLDVKNQDGMYMLTDSEHIAYEKLIQEWTKEVEKTNHSDQLLQINAIETRGELKVLNKSFRSPYNILSSEEYQQTVHNILEWSKFRYIMTKDIFLIHIKSDNYKLHLNNQEIIFDYYSSTHILTRHYAEPMKPYETSKSHFTQDVPHEKVHLILEEAFSQIDASKIYLNDSVMEVNIRFNGIIYKIFVNKEHKAGQEILRLNSFFPTTNTTMLEKLKDEFEEKVIHNKLSVFVMKVVGL